MSREISIGYKAAEGSATTWINVDAPYFLFGCQDTSKQFWSIPKLKQLGVSRLSELGVADPIYFIGWDTMADLFGEITILQQHLNEIEFNPEIKSRWLSHLVYCYNLVTMTAPKESIPELIIG